jgi:hypothetical protein
MKINLNLFFTLFFLPVLSFILVFQVSENIFFWDTVQLASKHATYFYDNNFQSLLLPDDIDSGHIPVFGFYLAFIWKLFGKTLIFSHYAMIPFILGIIWQAFLLIKKFISKKYQIPALIIFLADATLISQMSLVSPDIILVFFFLTALNAVLMNKRFLLTISIIGLFLTSMRGMQVSLGILVLDLIFNLRYKKNLQLFKRFIYQSISYLPALIIFIAYSIYHYKVKHWVAYHENSPWAKNFEFTDFPGMIKNLGILIWRLLDFGRIFLWIPLIIIFLRYFKPLLKDESFRRILIIFITVLGSLSYSFILYKSLTAHRYILPVYLIFSLLTSYLIFEKIKFERLKFILFSVIIIGMVSGYFWVYPDKIAQGWDSTPVHFQYYKQKKEITKYMNQHHISYSETGSAFPNTSPIKYYDLSDNEDHFMDKNFKTNTYFYYTNIINDLNAEDIDYLKNNYDIIFKVERLGVFSILYKKTGI